MRRVVVTGLGLVTPLGCGVQVNWERLIAGECGIDRITAFDVSDLSVQIGAMVPRGDHEKGQLDPDRWVEPKEQRKMGDFILYALVAATQALEDSGWKPETDADRERTGVMIGSGIGGLPGIYEASLTLEKRGPRRVSPFFLPSVLINLASGHVSIRHGLKGPNNCAVTACSTGAHSIGDAARIIQYEDADVMVAGGAEAAVCRIGIAGFAAARALASEFNDRPKQSSRPWDVDRDGFVMGEGAGVVVLEELEHAKARGAKIYGELVGYGMSGDAHHVTAPASDGNGAIRSMKAALKRAKLNPTDIDYINAHGTSTPLGDEIEIGAVKTLFGEHAYSLSMSSTKSAIGHLLGAAGSVEAVYSILAMRDGIAPPTLNLDKPSEGCDIDLVAHKARERPIRAVMSNSFGFGGTNATLVFTAYP